jgi:transketolase
MTYRNPREEYGRALLELARADRNVFALDADLCKSTMTCLVEKELPAQYVEMGIAEQNMLSTAAGLALSGKIAFANSFAVFLTGRAFDQIRQAISLSRLNVKIVGSSAGLSDFGDGSTHQSIEDVALMRSIPNMTVVVPADGLQTRAAVRAIAAHPGPVYLRIGRGDLPDVTAESDSFVIGRLQRLREGSDVTVFAMGTMVQVALAAAELAAEGLSVRVVNTPTLKPLDPAAVVAETCGTRAVVTTEEHSIVGGLGSTIAECLRRERLPIEFHGVADVFGQSSNTPQPLLDHYGLNAANLKTVITRAAALG